MLCRILITAISVTFLILNLSCSSFRRITFHPEIYQGNYLEISDILRIHLGMTQQQIIHILGSPIITDPFEDNTWFYIFRQELNQKNIKQQTLILTFDKKGLLVNINWKPTLKKN